MTQIVHDILGNRLGVKDPKSIKIDRAHRIEFEGKQARKDSRPRAMVTIYSNKERVLANARKFKGTRMAVSEQFPDENTQLFLSAPNHTAFHHLNMM